MDAYRNAPDIVIVALFVVAFALVSARLSRTIISAPMVFVGAGLLFGPRLLGIVDLRLENEIVTILAELTLVIVLYSDAARIDLRVLRRHSTMPIRLLGIGLPLAIVAGIAVGLILFDGLTIWEIAILAVILAPTDAALGQAVASDMRVPVRIRQALNVESGLNDGIAVPFLTVFIAAASVAIGLHSEGFLAGFAFERLGIELDSPQISAGVFAVEQIGGGIVIGVGIGYVIGKLIDLSVAKEWTNRLFQGLAVLAIPFIVFSLAEIVGGNGFIAAFTAGLTMGSVTRRLGKSLFEFSEEEGQLFLLLTFMVFGGAFVGRALNGLTWQIALYAVLSLTVVRMVPVAISMIGMRLRMQRVVFLGWFGPRGLASIVFGLQVLETDQIAGREEIFLVAVWTVLFSIILHGVTALPGVNWYARHADRMVADQDRPEMVAVEELPHAPALGFLRRFDPRQP